ncbi:MAG: sigma-70 family RNA polymerase sigma factor [Bryobacteraceae bacterium]|nr:sigma-70 family RNA polymerase sigma factor [Bryobacteraceae bacterium]
MCEVAVDTARGVNPSGPSGEDLDFAAIVRANQAMVYSIAFHFLRDHALAEELAQDVFLQLHQNLSRLSSGAHVVHWLRKVTSHRCIDRSRRSALVREVDLDAARLPVAEPAFSDPLLSERLQKLVASLPKEARLLVILRYQEDMQPEEIARLLEMPVTTVRTRLFRTLEHLRAKASHFLGRPHESL